MCGHVANGGCSLYMRPDDHRTHLLARLLPHVGNLRLARCHEAFEHLDTSERLLMLSHTRALGRIVLRLVRLKRGLAGLGMAQPPLQLLDLGEGEG